MFVAKKQICYTLNQLFIFVLKQYFLISTWLTLEVLKLFAKILCRGCFF
jgi:hypothetical protein